MTRIASVDGFRIIASIAVIALHTAVYFGPHAVGNGMDSAAIFNNAERFAVPMFFLLSGYFWADPSKTGRELLRKSVEASKRIFMIFLFWSLVYLAVPLGEPFHKHGWLGAAKAFYWSMLMPGGVFNTIFAGPQIHLWFLPALISVTLICGVFGAIGLKRALPLLAVGLFAVGLAGRAYADTPVGLHSDLMLRNGPFFGLIFFVTGTWLRQRPSSPRWLVTGALLAITGFTLQIAEVAFLHAHWGASTTQDFVLSTYPFGVGVGLMALSNARRLQMRRLAPVGRLALGIYASHYLFIELFRPLNEAYRGQWWWDAGYVAFIFALALGFTHALSAIPFLRGFVTQDRHRRAPDRTAHQDATFALDDDLARTVEQA